MFAATFATVETPTSRWEVLTYCDENACTCEFKPPVPPPRIC